MVEHRARLVIIFLGAFALIGIGLVASIFALRIKPELVVPVVAIATAANVFVFGLRFDRARPQPMSTLGPPVRSTEANPALAFLRIAIIVVLSLGAFILVKLGVDAWLGMSDPGAFWRFLPKLAFGVVFSLYALRKIRDREQF